MKTRSKLNSLTSSLSTKILGGSHGVPCVPYFDLEILTKNILQCFQSWVTISCLEITPLIIFQHLKCMVLPYSFIYNPNLYVHICQYFLFICPFHVSIQNLARGSKIIHDTELPKMSLWRTEKLNTVFWK